jgi:hypothetical protein
MAPVQESEDRHHAPVPTAPRSVEMGTCEDQAQGSYELL